MVPAITLINELKGKHEIHYVGGRKGIERELISNLHIAYHPIFTGKLRRYFSWENLLDLFRFVLGIIQAFFLLLRFKRHDCLIFSTGGFVTVPVVIGGRLTGKKIFIHEQTTRVGLANRICSRFADKIFVSFEESLKFFPKGKTFFSGYPLRDECYQQDINGEVEIDGYRLTEVDRPILFITGGGNGAQLINELVEKHLALLKEKYFIVHQVGSLFIEKYAPLRDENYHPVAFVASGMIDLFKLANVVISRAGAGTVCELLALGKRTIFIPLKIAQKNEQYHNAMVAHDKLGSVVLAEEQLISCDLMELVSSFDEVAHRISAMKNGKEFLIGQIVAAGDLP